MSRPTYTREIMAGTIFAGGRVSSFHLTSLARHSVRRPPRRFPRPLEGLDSLRASGRVEQASQPALEVRELLRYQAQRLSYSFPPCLRCSGLRKRSCRPSALVGQNELIA